MSVINYQFHRGISWHVSLAEIIKICFNSLNKEVRKMRGSCQFSAPRGPGEDHTIVRKTVRFSEQIMSAEIIYDVSFTKLRH